MYIVLSKVTRDQCTAARRQRRLEGLQGLEEAGGVEEEGATSEGGVSEGAHPYTWLHDKEREDQEMESTVGCSREESGGRASRAGKKTMKNSA